MVAYGDLYLDLTNYYQRKENFPAILHWAAAHIAYDEQNDREPLNLLNSWRDLAKAYRMQVKLTVDWVFLPGSSPAIRGTFGITTSWV